MRRPHENEIEKVNDFLVLTIAIAAHLHELFFLQLHCLQLHHSLNFLFIEIVNDCFRNQSCNLSAIRIFMLLFKNAHTEFPKRSPTWLRYLGGLFESNSC